MAGRSNGGHRRYTPEQMRMLHLMRDKITRGHPAVEAAALVRAAQTRPTDPLIAAFLDAAHHLDATGIDQSLNEACQALGLERVVVDVLLPAMREIGRWWEMGRCDVAHEHLATQTIQAWLAKFTRPRPRSRQHKPLILSCGPRDHHTLDLESMGTLLMHRGMDCRVLGARTPADSLSKAVQKSSPRRSSWCPTCQWPAVRRSKHSAQYTDRRALFYAGNAFLSPQSRRGVPGTYLGNNFSQAADTITGTITNSTTDYVSL